jgi:hypothetical protein
MSRFTLVILKLQQQLSVSARSKQAQQLNLSFNSLNFEAPSMMMHLDKALFFIIKKKKPFKKK